MTKLHTLRYFWLDSPASFQENRQSQEKSEQFKKLFYFWNNF